MVASTALGLLKAHLQAMGEIENRLSRDLVEDLLDAAVTAEAAGARPPGNSARDREPSLGVSVGTPMMR